MTGTLIVTERLCDVRAWWYAWLRLWDLIGLAEVIKHNLRLLPREDAVREVAYVLTAITAIAVKDYPAWPGYVSYVARQKR